jgi:phosphoribosylaminoimidazolecarboxamide formyltransferase / IMP cyclohydrolase
LPEASAESSALLSLSNLDGAAELARALAAQAIAIYATSGTRAFLAERGIATRDVSDLTGFPPLFEGRVKTLHPNVFGGILYDRNVESHVAQVETYAIPSIVAVAVTLYPSEIDVGGVALLRAAAKNHEHVAVLSDPAQYPEYLEALERGEISHELRRRLAVAAFNRTATYDAAIARALSESANAPKPDLPEILSLGLPLAQRLRYGGNPQERAVFYRDRAGRLPEQLHGKALSYNNLLDLDATLRLLARAPLGAEIGSRREEFIRAAVVKHTVPCGVAQRSTVAKAVSDALAADAISAFGGVVATDAPIDVEAARSLGEFFLEIVAAPDFEDAALALLRRKKNLRIMRFAQELPEELAGSLRVRSALGGVLAETADPSAPAERWSVASDRSPTPQEWHDLAFAWDVVRHVKSNGVVIARHGVTVGICAGQTNRVSAVQIAGDRAGPRARGAACASDGFFPFADGLEAAVAAGCSGVIAPGGSIRDAEVIAAANGAGIAFVLSSYRYFLH